MARSYGSRTGFSIDVVLNVYDLSPVNDYAYPIGLGAYHSGVEVNGREYTFAGGGGVFYHSPKNPPGAGMQGEIPVKFRESVKIGTFTGGQNGLETIISQLKESFSGNDYHVVRKNCNHFAESFVKAMLPEQSQETFPAYVNRLAWLGSFVPCLFPPENPDPAASQAQSNNHTFMAPLNANASSNNNLTNRRPFAGRGITLGGENSDTTSTGTGRGPESLSSEERRRRIRQATLNRMSKAN